MSSVIGFPCIGKNRELKFALEKFWDGKISEDGLYAAARQVRERMWRAQKSLDRVCVNDFSFYDNVLDVAFAIAAIPKRFRVSGAAGAKLYFGMARGLENAAACEMTKWFDTNYHYVVPELAADDVYRADASKIRREYEEARALGFEAKISLVGPFTFTALSKIAEGSPFAVVLENVLGAYRRLLEQVTSFAPEAVVQIEEPIFCRGEDARFFPRLESAFSELCATGARIVVATYFGHSPEAVEILSRTPIEGFALDFASGEGNFASLGAIAESGKTLAIGVIDGRNVWRADLSEALSRCVRIAQEIPRERLSISTSCSLRHVPFGKNSEEEMDAELRDWLSFAEEKVGEVKVLESVFRDGVTPETEDDWETHYHVVFERKFSHRTRDAGVRARMEEPIPVRRSAPFSERIKIQRERLGYPMLPTTTIGSFPQTRELRALRKNFREGEISEHEYAEQIEKRIAECIALQEEIGLDVLVHGEFERNDMVEFFGERLDGFLFTRNGWVQSYGSRCVKPPIIFGDVARPRPMTVREITFAQSLTKKPVKGMLTGPVTILNWSFVRDDLPRAEVAMQIALAIRDEISDLQDAGIGIVQVDEAAFKEGYPLRAEDVPAYEAWALRAFGAATSVALPSTQIHTHMCYSEFGDIIEAIKAMDADVISIETARSGNALLRVFESAEYSHEIGPGVYDIHSPRVPDADEMEREIRERLKVIPKELLWVNPDCGLKTRRWEEVVPALKNMVAAARRVSPR
ncbi:MAG: 5-methyltetrahydropteroyltriglutamate--homocysteine S-methyltransferase [Candidatus Spyradosoma sp.]